MLPMTLANCKDVVFRTFRLTNLCRHWQRWTTTQHTFTFVETQPLSCCYMLQADEGLLHQYCSLTGLSREQSWEHSLRWCARTVCTWMMTVHDLSIHSEVWGRHTHSAHEQNTVHHDSYVLYGQLIKLAHPQHTHTHTHPLCCKEIIN